MTHCVSFSNTATYLATQQYYAIKGVDIEQVLVGFPEMYVCHPCTSDIVVCSAAIRSQFSSPPHFLWFRTIFKCE